MHKRFIALALYPALIFILNIVIAAKLFRVEYSAYLLSNEGTFIAIARQVAMHPGDLRWWRLWDCGMPFQNTYLPLLHLITGAFSRISGHSPALSFHQVSAFFFAIGPVCVYFLARAMTHQSGASFLAAAAYSVLSPCAWIFPAIRNDLGGAWNLRRLQILAYYGEGPHTAALVFLPLGIMFLYLALVERRWWQKIAAGVALSATVLSNAFGAVILIMAAICLLATIETSRFWRNAGLFLVIGALSYAFISPLLPPSVIAAIRMNSPTVDGDYRFTQRSMFGVAALTAGFFLLWWITRKAGTPVLRFLLLYSFLTAGIIALGFAAHVYVVPQPHRYAVAMDMALCLLIALSAATFLRTRIPRAVPSTALLCVLALLVSFRHDVRYARGLIRGIDIRATPPYRIARWMDKNMHGQRVMVSGADSYYFNVFTDTPQLHGGHDPMQLNFMMRIAMFFIYSGMNAGRRDGQITALWLRALGAHAVSVPDSSQPPDDKLFGNPRKFEGLLPVLWRDGPDTIYAVPSRSGSLVHIIPADAVVRDPPINGLDTHEIERYVSALDDPSLPEAELSWQNGHTAIIKAQLAPHQVISVQETYAPGWRATFSGLGNPSRRKISKDGLGFLVIEPDCQGPCEILLAYDGGPEWRVTCLASLLALLAVALCAARRRHHPAV